MVLVCIISFKPFSVVHIFPPSDKKSNAFKNSHLQNKTNQMQYFLTYTNDDDRQSHGRKKDREREIACNYTPHLSITIKFVVVDHISVVTLMVRSKQQKERKKESNEWKFMEINFHVNTRSYNVFQFQPAWLCFVIFFFFFCCLPANYISQCISLNDELMYGNSFYNVIQYTMMAVC